MKKLTIALILIAAFGLIPAAVAGTGKKQTKCPICKMDVNKDLHVDYKGKRVYFGCSGCPAEFKKNPDKYIAEMEARGIELEKAPVEKTERESTTHVQQACACGSDHLNFSLFEDVSGKRVYFCGEKCKDHFMQAPEKNVKMMEKKGIKLEKAPKK